MTILEKFIAFAEQLPAEQRGEVEEFLASIMDSDAPEFAPTGEELAKIDQRLADPNSKRIDEESFRAKLRTIAR